MVEWRWEAQAMLRAAARRWLEDRIGGPRRFVDAVMHLRLMNKAAQRQGIADEAEEGLTNLESCEAVYQACQASDPEKVVRTLVQLTEQIEETAGPEPMHLTSVGIGLVAGDGRVRLKDLLDWLVLFQELYGPDRAAEVAETARQPGGITELLLREAARELRFRIEQVCAGRPYGGIEGGEVDDAMVRFEEYAAALPDEKSEPLPFRIHTYDTATDNGDQWARQCALKAISEAVAEKFGAPWELPAPIRSFDKCEVAEAAQLSRSSVPLLRNQS